MINVQNLKSYNSYFKNFNYGKIVTCERRIGTIGSIQQRDVFINTLPKIMNKLIRDEPFKDKPFLQKWLKTIIYNNVDGKKIRGLTTVCAFESFENAENINEQSLELACVAGWCVEMMQGYLVITDDIVDNSSVRRGSPCWYRRPDVGLRAVIDALLIKGSYCHLLKIYFQDKPYYTQLLEIFNDAFLYTSIGQHLDCTSTALNKDYSRFTTEHYNEIVKYKTSHYTFNLPVSIAFVMTNNTNANALKLIEELSCDIGHLFQVQNDYSDLYGDPKGDKEGNDIQEGKCTWLAVTALEKCSPRQRIVFKACYGSQQTAHYERIHQLYKDLKLPELYDNYKQEQYKKIGEKINKLPPYMNQDLFMRILKSLY